MNPFEEIAKVHPTLAGWASVQKAVTLAAMVVSFRPKISLEIGCYGGKSCFGMAMAHRFVGTGRLIAVDPWTAAASVEGQVNELDRKWWSDQKMHDWVHADFMAKRDSLGLRDWIQVEHKTSDEFNPEDGIGILSVDGNHGDQAIKDIQRYAPKVESGGYLVADDLNWSGGSVSRAIALLPAMGFSQLYIVDDKESQNQWGVWRKE